MTASVRLLRSFAHLKKKAKSSLSAERVAMNLSFNVPYPIVQIGENPFDVVLPELLKNEVSHTTATEDEIETVDSEEMSNTTVNDQIEEIDFESLVCEKAREMLDEQLQAPMEAVESLMSALQEKFEHELHVLENSAVKLAFAIAEKVVHQVAQESSETITAQVREVLNNCKKELSSTLFLHPEDYQFIKENSDLILQIRDKFPGLEFKEAPEISRGGCKLESDNGTIDATIEKQLNKIATELLHVS
ncbi:MAG: hypothetical protein DWQ10_12565 [Calditrichaeota bacterium]|nr:MAG: hypothetical protein DWQ10_12565 [Calditrichota bacterium]